MNKLIGLFLVFIFVINFTFAQTFQTNDYCSSTSPKVSTININLDKNCYRPNDLIKLNWTLASSTATNWINRVLLKIDNQNVFSNLATSTSSSTNMNGSLYVNAFPKRNFDINVIDNGSTIYSCIDGKGGAFNQSNFSFSQNYSIDQYAFIKSIKMKNVLSPNSSDKNFVQNYTSNFDKVICEIDVNDGGDNFGLNLKTELYYVLPSTTGNNLFTLIESKTEKVFSGKKEITFILDQKLPVGSRLFCKAIVNDLSCSGETILNDYSDSLNTYQNYLTDKWNINKDTIPSVEINTSNLLNANKIANDVEPIGIEPVEAILKGISQFFNNLFKVIN
ncbi:MAG: hypothetical protein PHQ98_02320 [Candidatus ainarchaeum sp.]|nr:hypothetical protein [Candidatus ainarchaeum sp.]